MSSAPNDCALADIRVFITIIDAPMDKECFEVKTTFGWAYGGWKMADKTGQVIMAGVAATKDATLGIEFLGQGAPRYRNGWE